jgi:hypothetical protein
MGGMFRAVMNAVSTDHRQCPVWSCRKRVSLEDFPFHLLSHQSEDLVVAIPALAQEGYAAVKFGCEHSEEDVGSTDDPCFCKVTSIELMCPICASRHHCRLSLKTHVEEAHLGSGENVIAFRREILALVLPARSSHPDIVCR